MLSFNNYVVTLLKKEIQQNYIDIHGVQKIMLLDLNRYDVYSIYNKRLTSGYQFNIE